MRRPHWTTIATACAVLAAAAVMVASRRTSAVERWGADYFPNVPLVTQDGDKVGPDLAGVTTLRERAWLARLLAEPEVVLDEGDPVASALFAKYNRVQMPNLSLSTDDVADLLSYLDSTLSRAQAPAQRGLTESWPYNVPEGLYLSNR